MKGPNDAKPAALGAAEKPPASAPITLVIKPSAAPKLHAALAAAQSNIPDRSKEIKEVIKATFKSPNAEWLLAKAVAKLAGTHLTEDEVELEFKKILQTHPNGTQIPVDVIFLKVQLDESRAEKIKSFYKETTSALRSLVKTVMPAGDKKVIMLDPGVLLQRNVLAELAAAALPTHEQVRAKLAESLVVAPEALEKSHLLGSALLKLAGIDRPQQLGESTWGNRSEKLMRNEKSNVVVARPGDTQLWLTLAEPQRQAFHTHMQQRFPGCIVSSMNRADRQGQPKNIQVILDTNILHTTIAEALGKVRAQEEKQQPQPSAVPPLASTLLAPVTAEPESTTTSVLAAPTTSEEAEARGPAVQRLAEERGGSPRRPAAAIEPRPRSPEQYRAESPERRAGGAQLRP